MKKRRSENNGAIVLVLLFLMAATSATASPGGKDKKADGLKQKLEAALAEQYPPAKFDKSFDRNWPVANITDEGQILYVALDGVLSGTAAAESGSVVNTSSDGSTTNSSLSFSGLMSHVLGPSPQSLECSRVATVNYPAGTHSTVSADCLKDVADKKAEVFKIGQRVVLGKINANPGKNLIELWFLDAKALERPTSADEEKSAGKAGGKAPEKAQRYLGHVDLVFPPGGLETATLQDLEEAVSVVLVKQDKIEAIKSVHLLAEQLKTVFTPAVFTGSLETIGNLVDVSKPGAVLRVENPAAVAEVSYQVDAEAANRPISQSSTGGSVHRISAEGCSKGTVVELPAGSVRYLDSACAGELSAGRAHLAAAGQKVMVAQVQSVPSQDEIVLELLDAGAGTNKPSFAATVVFRFTKGYLATANAVQVQDAISAVLAPDMGVAVQPAASAPVAVQSLAEQLNTIYQVTTLTPDGTIGKLGAQLKLLHATGLAASPVALASPCAATFADGKLKPGLHCAAAGAKAGPRGFHDGEAVTVTAIHVDEQKSVVRFEFVDCPAGAGSRPTAKTAIAFTFSPGYLKEADGGQVVDVVSNELQLPQ